MKKNNRKGIVLAGGSGSRLLPATSVVSKQILTIYDKPMIYYSLSVLMLSGIREILLISTARDIDLFKLLLGDGSKFGISISYKIQNKPNGIAESFIIGKEFIGSDDVALILGDNLFYGSDLQQKFKKASLNENATIFSCNVHNPSNYGVVEFNNKKQIINIEEKPKLPKSNFAVTGLYFYDNNVINLAKNLKPSKRGELEITDINNFYVKSKKLFVEFLSRGNVWLDMGTHDSLLEASNLVSTIQKRQGHLICCPEEIAYLNNWISEENLEKIIQTCGNNQYSNYLKRHLN